MARSATGCRWAAASWGCRGSASAPPSTDGTIGWATVSGCSTGRVWTSSWASMGSGGRVRCRASRTTGSSAGRRWAGKCRLVTGNLPILTFSASAGYAQAPVTCSWTANPIVAGQTPIQSRARQMRFSSRTISWTAVCHRSGMKSRKICVCTTRAVAADAGRRESGERIDGRGSETERPRRAKRGRRSAAQRVEAAEEIGREVVPARAPRGPGAGQPPEMGAIWLVE